MFLKIKNSSLFRLVLPVFLLVGNFNLVSAFAEQEQVPRFEEAPCMFDMPAKWTEGENVNCGYLVVPEEYENPDGPTIRLAVAIIKSSDPNSQPDPIVFLQGGPGGSTIDTYSQVLPTRKNLPANRDIVLFDQRGTLYSEPALTCPELMDLTIQTLDEDLPHEEANQMSMDALEACRQRLASEGVNLSAYDSLENAADIASLQEALGYDQINLYGVSYGTLLALHAMRNHPEGLRSVILDSIVPTQTNFITNAPHTQNRSFEEVFNACEADQECNREYPNLRETFYDLVDQLNENPVTVQLVDFFETGQSYDTVVDGDTFMSTIFQMLYNTEFIPLIPRLIYDAKNGEWGFIERILSFIVFDRSMSYGMYYSVVCAEDADFTVDDYDLTGLPKQVVEMEKYSAEFILNACKMWNVSELGPSADEPVASDIPTLLLTGTFDPITPPEYARQAAETLPNSFLYEFPAGGHGEVGSTDCADQILVDFVNDPTQAPDASCIGSEGPNFSTRSDLVRLPVMPALLNLTGAQPVLMGLYLLSLLFMLSALLVYPVNWLVGLLRKPNAAQAVQSAQPGSEYSQTGVQVLSPASPAKKPFLYRFAPWSSVLAALTLLVFTAAIIGIIVSLVSKNDIQMLLGMPGSSRGLFLLPVIAGVLVTLMLLGALYAWINRAGSVWGKLYLSLLTIAGIVCLGVLASWGMLFALFT
jgi:pimeloyl-ACP methyl ester carboxylesterase